MSWTTIAGAGVIALGALMLIRTEVVYRARMKRIGEISRRGHHDIRTGNFGSLERRWEEFEATSYDSMMLDFRKWTYKQFYPKGVI